MRSVRTSLALMSAIAMAGLDGGQSRDGVFGIGSPEPKKEPKPKRRELTSVENATLTSLGMDSTPAGRKKYKAYKREVEKTMYIEGDENEV